MPLSKLERMIKFMPPELKAATNPILNALLSAWAGADEDILTQLENTKAQLFIATAEGNYLDRLASNVGVTRPASMGLLDSDFQQLIPNLAFKQKAIIKSFYDTMDVFWGPLFSRVNVISTLAEPFAVTTGDSFSLQVDNGATQTITVAPGDIRIVGAATALEMQYILSRFTGVTILLQPSPGSTANNNVMYTNTPGPRGALNFISGFSALGINTGRLDITDIPQRTVVYQINSGEILIELPAIVPTLRRSLRGSHHFHADATLSAPIPPGNGVWQGSFFYSSTQNPFVATKTVTTLQQDILAGSVQFEITVADTSAFPVTGGSLVFDFGFDAQEEPVPFITETNSNTLVMDPAYVFTKTHVTGAPINLLMPGQTRPYAPRTDGQDLAVYLPSPASARDVVEQILESIAAAGIVVNFLVLLPSYEYITDNPYAI